MAVLNSWQKIDRVLPGQPFGNGADGAYTSTSIPSLTVKTCSGSASSTTLAADTDASPFSVGDVLLLHQTRGTGVGQWEINRVSAVGSDQYTLQAALNYTYTDSGASQAQAIKIPQYSSIDVSSGTWTMTAWDGDVNGIFPFACNGTCTLANTVTGAGSGFRAGASSSTDGAKGQQGEGTDGAGGTLSFYNNGSGGGGGDLTTGTAREGGGGGGGGNGAAGSAGEPSYGNTSGVGTPAEGGDQVGAADATTFDLGGGGGGGSSQGSASGAGGDGGALIAAFAKVFDCSGATISLNGANGSNASLAGGGGGGSGGSFLLACQTGTLGTNKITVAAGSGGTGGSGGAYGDGGAGAVGRIAIHHSGTLSGSTTPTLEDTTDTSLIENPGSYMFVMS